MSLRNLTWQQVAILVACLAATIAAYKFLGPDAGSIAAVVSTVLSFVLGREPPGPGAPPAPAGPEGPSLKLLAGGAAAAALVAAIAMSGCAGSAPPGAQYAAEQASCASTSRTLAESKACRARVDRAWGVDAGADGAR